MSTTTIVRNPYLRVTVNGIEIRDRFSASCTFGFDQQTSTATFTIPVRGVHTPLWGIVEIYMGASQQTARLRFRGLITDVSYALWPRAVTVNCQGMLSRAEFYRNTSNDGTNYSGMTDQAQVDAVLVRCGVTNRDIRGTGHQIGLIAEDQAVWDRGQSGLSYIQMLDEISLGYRTYDTVGGSVVRRQLHARPLPTAAMTFVEGHDIFSGSHTSDPKDTRNRISVTGYNDNDGRGEVFAWVQQPSPWLPPGIDYITEDFSNPLIERPSVDAGSSGIPANEIARWKLHVLNRLRQQVSLDTPREDMIHPGTTIRVESPNRLGIAATYWVQSVTVSISESGQFTQSLSVVGGPVSGGSIDGASGYIPPETGDEEDTDDDDWDDDDGDWDDFDPNEFPPFVDFMFHVEQEIVLVDGSATPIYIVYAESFSEGWAEEIETQEWYLEGANPETGTGEFFTTRINDIEGRELVLTVTDFNGAYDTLSLPIDVAEAEITRRVLYSASETVMEAFDSEQWRVQEPGNQAAVSEVANGPFWIAGEMVYSSGDMLISPPVGTIPFQNESGGASANPTAISAELDAYEQLVYVGSSDGRLAVSMDHGETWEVVDGPQTDPVIRCSISRFGINHRFVMYSDAFYETHDGGITWIHLQTAESGEQFVDLNVSFARIMIAMIGGRLLIEAYSGAPQLFGEE